MSGARGALALAAVSALCASAAALAAQESQVRRLGVQIDASRARLAAQQRLEATAAVLKAEAQPGTGPLVPETPALLSLLAALAKRRGVVIRSLSANSPSSVRLDVEGTYRDVLLSIDELSRAHAIGVSAASLRSSPGGVLASITLDRSITR